MEDETLGSMLGILTQIYWRESHELIEQGIALGDQNAILRKLSHKEENLYELPRRTHPDYYLAIELKETEYSWYEDLMKVLLALQLCKNHTIFIETMILGYLLEPIKANPLLDPPRMRFEAAIGQKEIELTTSILEKLRKKDFESDPSFKIATDRYMKIHSSRYIPDQIIDACISYEALFLSGKRIKRNRRSVIARECAKLISTNTEEMRNIRQIVDQGFQIRNDIVHGTDVDNEILHKTDTLFIEYLRQSLVRKIMT